MLKPFFLWFSEHFYSGIFLYIIIFAIFKTLIIPTSIMVLGAALVYGNLFGIAKGFLISLLLIIVSADLGALFAFSLGRLCLKNTIRKYMIT